MGSVDTLVLKQPTRYSDSDDTFHTSKTRLGFISVCLWTLTAIAAVSNAETSGNVSGVSITFKLQDVLSMLLSTFLMARGFSTSNPYLIYPWIFISGCNIYKSQYPNVMKMFYTFQKSKVVTKFAYIALGLHTLSLVIKVLLILQITQLAFMFWYQRKFQKKIV